MRGSLFFSFAVLLAACSTAKKPAVAPEPPAANFVSNMRQLTFEGRRAGEGYPSADGKKLVFQSERESDNPFYQIYLMDMASGKARRVSPGHGKTTCAWIHPSGQKIMFASTHADPDLKKKVSEEWEERKAPKKRYNWSFDETYDIFEVTADGKNAKNLTRTKGYDAEGSYSPDGRWIAFASNRAAYSEKMSEEDAKIFARDPSYMMDIYIMRADGRDVKRLTTTKGYDGGPFFSPDGKRLTFRRFSEDGHKAEVFTMNIDGTDQKQITRLNAMSWAPFYHPTGDYLIFGTNKLGYANFELYIVDVEGRNDPVRATDLPNFDGLPAFMPDGRTLVWTHANDAGEAQLYRADWDDRLAREKLKLPAPAPAGVGDTKAWVEYLSSEKFKGRATGGASEPEYQQRLSEAFKAMGLKPFLQKFEFTRGIEMGANNRLSVTGSPDLTPQKDWIPLSYAKNGQTKEAPVVFAGYGIKAPAQGNAQPEYDSYGGVDVKGKWVMVFGGLPEDVSQERRFFLHIYSRLQHKATVARQSGAAGLIVIDAAATPESPLKIIFEGRSEDAGLPVLRLSNAVAERIFKAANSSREEWTGKLKKGETATLEIPNIKVAANIDLNLLKGQTGNLLAKLEVPGAKGTVVVGAHLDHLGVGQHGTSLAKVPDAVHYGADDNASGVAGVIEVARLLSDRQKRGEIQLRQNILFALWSGEEIGILGSNYFAKNTREKILAAINMDMIGRLRDSLIVQGIGSAKEWKGLVEQANFQEPMKLTMQEDPYLPTDALSFYLKQIPSISLFTGSHPEYHTDQDTPEKINYEGLTRIARWAARLTALAAQDAVPSLKYVKVEGGRQHGAGRGFRLYLGTIPDYASEKQKGVLISGTSKDSPAEKAGLQAGDVITELGGMKIENLNDYVYCLQALKANETVKLKLRRGEKDLALEITPVLKTQAH